MALPLDDRVRLAQQLWKSLEECPIHDGESEALTKAIERDRELSSGTVVGQRHFVAD